MNALKIVKTAEAPKNAICAGFFRMKEKAPLLFVSANRLFDRAEMLICDAKSLIAKADDHQTARVLFEKAKAMLEVANAKRKGNEKTVLLLSNAYIGIAGCKKESGEAYLEEASKAYAHSASLVCGTDSHKEAWTINTQAWKMLIEKK